MPNNQVKTYHLEHHLLNCYTIKLLQKNRINTVPLFLNHSIDNLIKIINLSYAEVLTIKNDLIRRHAMVPINGLTYYKNIIENFQFLSTGVKSFDQLLGGGFITGNIYEICGISGIGKTQLCQTVALHLSTYYKMKTLWIDTTNNFSAIRLNEMIFYNHVHYDEISGNCRPQKVNISLNVVYDKLNRIKIQSTTDPFQFLHILNNIRRLLMTECSEERSQIKLIIIDSLPALWFLFLDDIAKGRTFLVETANRLRQLANEYHLVIIIVNTLTRWMDIEHEKQTQNGEHLKLCMGKLWQSVPSTRFLIRNIMSESSQSTITNNINVKNIQVMHKKPLEIEIIKSNQFKIGDRCKVMLTNKGVV